MKTRQLANLLIKILGLSVIVHGIPIIVAMLLSLPYSAGGRSGLPGIPPQFLHLLPTLIQVGIGVYLIVKSREVTAFLFKDQQE